ncbi:MAG: class I SAM-dependent methyltransferase [Solirubrobacteraceae bacterium]
MIASVAREISCRLLSRIGTGELVVVEDGERRVFGDGVPTATVHVNSPRVWPMLAGGGRGMAASYMAGLWDTPDLTAVIRIAALNVHRLDDARRRLAPVRAPWQRLRGALGRNTPTRSRRAISAHYDIGNDLFALMLDPTMMYSCALFERNDATLEEASLAKLERVCERLDLGPEDDVIEIGTGWGGFAVHAATTRACRVTTTTISREQYDYAVARVREAGLEDRVTVLLDDYRELRGSYDKLVSIEMIEAVGWKDFGTYFARCSELLKPDGAMFLQAITIDDRAYQVEKNSKSFIRSYIFPNGCLPSLEVIARCLGRRTDLSTVDLEDITPHYAETLRRWRANFDAAGERIAELGYDERFRRLWRLYLSYCEAGFAERRIGLVQMTLTKPQWRAAGPAAGVPPGLIAAAAG